MSDHRVVLRFLDQVGDERLVFPAFREAFADYDLDMSYMNEAGLLNRMRKNGVDYSRSVGMFDGGKMVGFTLAGLGMWQGRKAAFDAGTGMVKAYRGQGYAGSMFDMIRAQVQKDGVSCFVLEVLQQNETAVKAYRKAGFEITRRFKCFRLKKDRMAVTGAPADAHLVVEKREKADISFYQGWLDWPPSWELNPQAVQNTPDQIDCFAAVSDGREVGVLLFYPNLGWILTLVVRPDARRRGIGRMLLNHFLHSGVAGYDRIKVVNVLQEDVAMQALLTSVGFENEVDQYEMVMVF